MLLWGENLPFFPPLFSPPPLLCWRLPPIFPALEREEDLGGGGLLGIYWGYMGAKGIYRGLWGPIGDWGGIWGSIGTLWGIDGML